MVICRSNRKQTQICSPFYNNLSLLLISAEEEFAKEYVCLNLVYGKRRNWLEWVKTDIFCCPWNGCICRMKVFIVILKHFLFYLQELCWLSLISFLAWVTQESRAWEKNLHLGGLLGKWSQESATGSICPLAPISCGLRVASGRLTPQHLGHASIHVQ